jgi:hypothetical protein
MKPMNTESVKQYRAELTLAEKATITINAQDREQIHEIVTSSLRATLGGNPSFGPGGDGENSIFVYHSKVADGKQPCGWIQEFTVPSAFSIQKLTENRMRELQAA